MRVVIFNRWRSARAAGALLVVATATPLTAQSASPATCGGTNVGVQILGSGGPFAGSSRASAGYLVWHRGRAIALVDAGGGTFLRFGEAGARLQDLALVAVSHLHPDHVADLTALLWQSEAARQHPLVVAGPSGGGAFPAMDVFLMRLFDPASGAFPILGNTVGGPGAGVRLDIRTIDATVGTRSSVMTDSSVEVSAMGVAHADVPSLAFRVQVGGRSVVFGSDQTALDPKFRAFAASADVLVLHAAISARAPDPLARLHARPATVGEAAQEARAKRLVLGHVSRAPGGFRTPEFFSLHDIDAVVAEVRQRFTGPLDVASDLLCVTVP